MKKLTPPPVNDAQALKNLAMNARAGSFPWLQPVVGPLTAGYDQYIAVRGNPFLVHSVPMSDAEKELLKGHYDSRSKDVQYIAGQREVTGAMVCSMCGSMHSGTLDHFLPKNAYPEFSIFSRNLVPACKCNTNRGEVTFGVRAGERLLHPYFDNCLNQRLVVAKFEGFNEQLPTVSLRQAKGVALKDLYSVAFHIQEILEKTYVKRYLFNKWCNLCRKPSLEVRDLKKQITTKAQLKTILDAELETLDDKFKTMNNWDSIFVTGLIDSPTLQWLFERMTAPGRLADDPLT